MDRPRLLAALALVAFILALIAAEAADPVLLDTHGWTAAGLALIAASRL